MYSVCALVGREVNVSAELEHVETSDGEDCSMVASLHNRNRDISARSWTKKMNYMEKCLSTRDKIVVEKRDKVSWH